MPYVKSLERAIGDRYYKQKLMNISLLFLNVQNNTRVPDTLY